MPSEGLASPSFGQFAKQGPRDRVEPKLRVPTAPRTADPTAMSDTAIAAEISGMVSAIDTKPRLFGFVPREAQLIPPLRGNDPADRPHIGSAFFLLPVGLISAAIVGVFFGIAFFLLAQPRDQTFVGASPASPGVEQAVRTATDARPASEVSATITASEQAARTPDPASRSPGLPDPPLPVSSGPAAAKIAGPPEEPTPGAADGSRSHAHSAARRDQSAHHHRQPARKELAEQADRRRIRSAAMDRAHHTNSLDPFQSRTPPQSGQMDPFDQLITRLTGQTKPVQTLTPPRAQ